MAPTGYQVASTAMLLGAKPPKRREAADVYFARMARIDEANRERSTIKRHDNVKTVRFRQEDRDGNRDEARNESRGIQAPAPPAGGERSGEDVTRDLEGELENGSGDIREVPALKDVTRRSVVVETPARVKELRSLPPLPKRQQHRIQQTRIDTSVSTPAASSSSGSSALSRNGNIASKKSRRDSQVTEIYFSPVDVNKSRISFTDPIDEPDELLTPTQERYDDQRRRAGAETQQPTTTGSTAEIEDEADEDGTARPRLMLKPEQVDRLVKALAECPLLHVYVSKQWWDDTSETATVLSKSETPSLTTSSSSPSTLYSQPNQPFVTEQRSPSITQEFLEEEFAREYPDHPKARRASRVASPRFGGIALCDPKVHGAPIRFVSKDYQLGANTLKVGQCSFLNIPYGTTVQSHLRIEPPSSKSINCRVMLQVVNQVLERKTGRKTYLLVAELDVTDSFTKAALMELSAYANMSLDDIELIAPGIRAMHREELDWCALANELQTSCAIKDVVEEAASSFAQLKAETCSMQTLTLMSELERLKARHQDFLVLCATGHHANGMLSGMHFPWTSQHLDQLLYDSDPHSIRGEASKAARLLRDRVAAAVAERCAGETAFDGRIWWGDQMRLVHCVPLLEGAEGRPAAWAAFLSDLGRYEGSLLQAFRLGYLCW